jgi:ferric-dicitrate binding protein FerR (iron transport regulator)
MLREVEHDAFSPVAAAAHAIHHPSDLQALTMPLPAASCPSPPPPTRRPSAAAAAAVAGAVALAALSVMWRAWQASDFESIV